MDKKLEILIVEDDEIACKELSQEIDRNPNDFILIGITNNATLAFNYVVEFCPDVVILDLELHHGSGDGIAFLRQIKDASLSCTPFVLITTNNISTITHKAAREYGADFIMTKNQEGYSAKSVLEFLKTTKSVIIGSRNKTKNNDLCPSSTETAKRVQRRICTELDKVGISAKTLGYTYLTEAITMVMKDQTRHICEKIGEKHRKSATSVERAMQNAIDRAWNTSDIHDLLDNYTARVKSDKGVPTLTEFIFYYAKKIKIDL